MRADLNAALAEMRANLNAAEDLDLAGPRRPDVFVRLLPGPRHEACRAWGTRWLIGGRHPGKPVQSLRTRVQPRPHPGHCKARNPSPKEPLFF